jgi:predicted nucleic acid-binding protein
LALIVDTGPLFAAMDQSDRDHRRCAELIDRTEERVVVPAPVLVEVDWLASQRLQPDAFLALMLDVGEGRLDVEELQPSDYVRIRELIERYSDLPLGFVDAAAVSVVERLGESKIATLDHRHFSVVRPRHVPALRLVP